MKNLLLTNIKPTIILEMIFKVSEITPKCREVCRALNKSAQKLKRLIFAPTYRLGVRMIIEDRIQDEIKNIPNPAIMYNGRLLPSVPLSPSFSEPLPQDVLNCTKKTFKDSISSQMVDLNYKMFPAKIEFESTIEPLKETISEIIHFAITRPELFTKPILYKEEAEALADIFSVLQEETINDISLSCGLYMGEPVVDIETSYSNAYAQVAKVFKNLARICSPRPKKIKNLKDTNAA